jgi:hypothetical protein
MQSFIMATMGQGTSIKKIVTLVCLIGFVTISLFSNSHNVHGVHVPITQFATVIVAEEPKREADGCYHVFLNVGANIGVQSRILLEPEKYPKARKAAEIFNSQFGTNRDNRDFCTFQFEPNPAHQAILEKISKAYEAMGWRYHVKNVGASDNDGTMDFYHQGNDNNKEEWGFAVKKLTDHIEASKISVPVIRFSTWLEEHVNKRKIPSAPHGSYGNSGPKVVMKMDVEGSEYVMLPDLMLSGTMCGIDFMYGEFHAGFAPLDFPGHRIPLKTRGEVQRIGEAMHKVIPSSRNCKTVFQIGDDESYLHDGMPLPVPKTLLGPDVGPEVGPELVGPEVGPDVR